VPFTLTLTPQYVAREIQKKLPVSYLKVQRYAERNADKLKAKAKFEKERGFASKKQFLRSLRRGRHGTLGRDPPMKMGGENVLRKLPNADLGDVARVRRK
jgi:hypothetical protein